MTVEWPRLLNKPPRKLLSSKQLQQFFLLCGDVLFTNGPARGDSQRAGTCRPPIRAPN